MANIVRVGNGGSQKISIVNVGNINICIPLGTTYSGTETRTIDIKSKIPNYNKLTKSNIIFSSTKIKNTHTDGNVSNNMTFSYDYNSSSGIITITGKYSKNNAHQCCCLTADVYVVNGTVERT